MNTENKEITVKEAIEVLCNALREDKSEGSKERVYKFTECKAMEDCKDVYITESKLESKFENLLLGEAYKQFSNLPVYLRKDFLNLLINK